MSGLPEAIDRLIEANAPLRKRRSLAKPERDLTRAMAKAFAAEENAFLSRLTHLELLFARPVLREVAEVINWEPLFDEAALATLRAFLGPIDEFTARALLAGGSAAVADLALETSFTLQHPGAVEYLRTHGATQVTRIRATTRETLRTILSQATEEGWSYQRTAKAIKQRYRHFSKVRAKNIAVFETGDAYEHGNMLVAQDLSAGGLEMQKQWLTVGDDRVRADHKANQEQGWIPLDDAFQDSTQRPPTDPKCLPGDCRVAAEGITATSERRYEGDFVVILTASDKRLTCTPNHPILTPHGWVAAGLLKQGDDVISSGGREWMRPVVDVNNDDMPATIEEVARAFRRSSKVTTRPVITAPAFHGDGKGTKVAVVRSHGLLGDSRYATIREHLLQLGLMPRVWQRLSLSSLSGRAQRFKARRLSHRRRVRPLYLVRSLFRRHLLPLQQLGFALAANGDASLSQSKANDMARDTEPRRDLVLGFAADIQGNNLVDRQINSATSNRDAKLSEALIDQSLRDLELARQLLDGSAGEVFADQIVTVDRLRIKTHVYNLETASGAYIANGIITHNCRCTLLMRRKPDA